MYCDFCDCTDCQNGLPNLNHAQTEDGKWICDVCYDYEVCQKDSARKGKGPCLNEEYALCTHRPKLITNWL